MKALRFSETKAPTGLSVQTHATSHLMKPPIRKSSQFFEAILINYQECSINKETKQVKHCSACLVIMKPGQTVTDKPNLMSDKAKAKSCEKLSTERSVL